MKFGICVHVWRLYAVLKFEANPTSGSWDITCQSCVAKSGFAKLAIFANVSFLRDICQADWIHIVNMQVYLYCLVLSFFSFSFIFTLEWGPFKVGRWFHLLADFQLQCHFLLNWKCVSSWLPCLLLWDGITVQPLSSDNFLFIYFLLFTVIFVSACSMLVMFEWHLTAAGVLTTC